MDCKEIRDIMFSDYIDGRCSEEVKRDIDNHLKACTSCTEALQEFRALGVSAMKEDYVPAFIWENVKQEINRPGKAHRFLSFPRGFFPVPVRLAMSTALIILSVAVFVFARGAYLSNAADDVLSGHIAFLDSLDSGISDESAPDNGSDDYLDFIFS